MATGLVTWSKTASSNATADASVNWAEGQAPSSVNDSARAMMASVAMYRDDTNGSIATGGSSSAYTVTSNQSFASLAAMDNAVIAFVPHTTSAGAPTLAVDGLTAKKIRFATGVDIPDGVLIEGTPYVVTYYNTVGEFILHNLAGNPYSIPLGGGMDYWLTTAPNSAFVFPFGQAISRTTYATLFDGMGTTHGSGDGSTTFNLPDKRGRVSAGKDNMGGSTAGRLSSGGGVTGTTLGAVGGVQLHTLTTTEIPSHAHANVINDPGHVHSNGGSDNKNAFADGSFGNFWNGSAQNTGSSFTGISITNANAGGGGAHPNVQPTIICNYIMRII